MGCVHPHPGPSPGGFKILQWNCNGIRSSADRLATFLHQQNILVAALQETKLSISQKTKPPSFPNYSLVRKDRVGGGGGGLAFLVHHSVSHLPVDLSYINDPTLEIDGIDIRINNVPTRIYNVYIPPSSSCPAGYSPSIASILDSSNDDIIFCGDVNAHHPSWDLSTNDVRGDDLASDIEQRPFAVLNDPSTPTRIPRGRATSPDLTLASIRLVPSVSWSASSVLNSDHAPIVISYDGDTPPCRVKESYKNFRRANWAGFKAEAERLVSSLPEPSSCSTGELGFRRALLEACKHNIPAGFRRDFVPGRPRHIQELIDRCDHLRAADHTDPNIDILEAEIRKAECEYREKTWKEKVEDTNAGNNPGKYYNLLRGLSGKRNRPPPNQPIHFKGKPRTHAAGIANGFIHQYPSLRRHRQDPLNRRTTRKIRKRRLDYEFSPFSSDDVKSAIDSSSNSSASGPDGLTHLHLKQIGPIALDYLTKLYNLSVQHADVPAIWKASIVIPILKPNKPADQSSSYRPISLLSPCIKVLERLLLPLYADVFPLSPSQHGFRSQRSTVTCLLPLVTKIAQGFNDPKPPSRSAIVAIDISKAFDTIDHRLLLEVVLTTEVNNNLLHWLAAWLRGRQACFHYQGARSKFKNIRLGVPQGSVLSPLLFNLFVAGCPEAADILSSFADDFSAMESSPDLDVIETNLVQAFLRINEWARSVKLEIAPSKSHVTLFTPDSHQSNKFPKISIDGVDVPLNKTPKILGVILDTHFSFAPHVVEIAKQCTARLSILRAVAGQDWGKSKETLLTTYKSLILSKLTYAAPIWHPNASFTSLKRLQTVQNEALRIATGCHRMSSIDHLHSEAKMLRISSTLDMRCTQFLASCMRPHHPSHHVVIQSPGHRNMKATLSSKFHRKLAPYLRNGIITQNGYNKTVKRIHTKAVSDEIINLGPNRVLGAIAPPIDKSELSLSRGHRSLLAQLRSGFSSSLRSYQHTIGKVDSPTCPDCGFLPQTTHHVFDCLSSPTNLTVYDLWRRPREVIRFLNSVPSFAHIPPLDPPAPPPPPEPPPT